jgi:hypothetical protein
MVKFLRADRDRVNILSDIQKVQLARTIVAMDLDPKRSKMDKVELRVTSLMRFLERETMPTRYNREI